VRLTVANDAAGAARLAADSIAAACRAAVAARARAVIACSGGSTPWAMLGELAHAQLPWDRIHVAQVDERCVPLADARRNLRPLRAILVEQGPLPAAHLLAMPVEADDLAAAAASYAAQLRELTAAAGGCLDLVQLGLGADGHTASLVPGDPVLAVQDRDVAVTALYEGTRRMTLTFRSLNAARARVWLVAGEGKRAALTNLLRSAGVSPALRVERTNSTVFADRGAAPDAD
jgi:6-phosphogluconolactonase